MAPRNSAKGRAGQIPIFEGQQGPSTDPTRTREPIILETSRSRERPSEEPLERSPEDPCETSDRSEESETARGENIFPSGPDVISLEELRERNTLMHQLLDASKEL